jgi:hypothetical protein
MAMSELASLAFQLEHEALQWTLVQLPKQFWPRIQLTVDLQIKAAKMLREADKELQWEKSG